MAHHIHSNAHHHPQQRQFNPYTENGGTILAIAGADFSVIAGDTRQSEGYNIQTRYAPKVFRLTDKAVLAVNGFAADGNMFVKKVKQRLEWYRHAHAKDMPLRAIARMIQTMLYAQRFFPYYVYNILGGIEEDGEHLLRCIVRAYFGASSHVFPRPLAGMNMTFGRGIRLSHGSNGAARINLGAGDYTESDHLGTMCTGAVYSFDPVGSYEREACRAAGAAQALVQPFLDNQIYFKNQTPTHGSSHPTHLPLRHVLELVIDSFTSATERHIEVGDGLEMYIVLARGRNLQGLEGVKGVQELSTLGDGGERVFVLRKDLKKD
ncbi:N-terminal nucleophile aminohydrolase [Ramaria rubella]|nr:N-terminal nucleophile aminohydrolase [Ramaria rubella]